MTLAASPAVLALALMLASAAPASAAWRLQSVRVLPPDFNQGVAVVPGGGFVFAGTPTPGAALWRTDARWRVLARRAPVLPRLREGYNHVGDIALDAARRRVLLSLECYHPLQGNTCRRGAFGVADARTLRFRYHVNLARGQIAKAMWVEASPGGRFVWTSAGRRLLVYDGAAVNGSLAAAQGAGRTGELAGRDLGPVLPTSAVTGATFLRTQAGLRLYLALNRGRRFEVVSYGVDPTGASLTGTPPVTEIVIAQSSTAAEPEGLAATPARAGRAAALHWLTQPSTAAGMRLRTYTAAP